MEAVVLAGGFGTRLREVVADVPKPMAPIGNVPFLEILLKSLAIKGFKNVVLSLGYMAEKISSYFGSHFSGMGLSYVVEDTPLGTGGATRLALSRCHMDHIFVFNGDTFLDLEVDKVEQLWQEFGKPIIVARQMQETERYGRLLVEQNYVRQFLEKNEKGPGLINAGTYVFSRDQLESWPLFERFSLEADYLLNAVKNEDVACFVTEGEFIDIGIPEDFQRAQILLRGFL